MTTASVRRERTHANRQPLLDRLLAAFPYVALALGVLVFYLVEAWSRKTPWVFTDELEWTQISRSIASTGHAARRGQPLFFKSVYAYVIAPFWWIHSTSAAYSAVKYANAVIMSLAAVPTYLLARMLVTRRAAVIVAVAAVAVPAMAYSTSIVPDVLAYPYFMLCSWLAVRALRSGGRRDVIVALVFLGAGYFVHQREFTMLPAAFVVAAACLWFTGPRGHALRRNWTRGDTIGFFALLLGAVYLFNRVVLQHVHEWQVTTEYWKNRMVDLGLDAGLSLAIGLGLLPVIGGLISLRLPERRGDAAYRAYVAWTATIIAVLTVYTADKAAYNSTLFATFWEERPLIFLSPLLLLGTAMVFQAKHINWLVAAGATGLVAVMVAFKGVQLGWPYYEAPGSAIPAVLNYYRGWTEHDVRLGLVGLLALSVVVLAFRRRRMVAIGAVAIGLGWMLAGEISMTAAMDHGADQIRANLPTNLTWVDTVTHGQPATYLGQGSTSTDAENLLEFWNRSIKHVDSLDGLAPGPGPTGTANLLSPGGLLSDLGKTPYVVTDSGIVLAAPVAARADLGVMVLYRRSGPWRLKQEVQQVFSDSWCPSWCSFTYFKPHQRGTLEITLGRTGYGGPGPDDHPIVKVGGVKIVDQAPQLRRGARTLHPLIRNGTAETIDVPVETPVRVEVTTPTRDLVPASIDPRNLGTQVSFKFVPAKQGSSRTP